MNTHALIVIIAIFSIFSVGCNDHSETVIEEPLIDIKNRFIDSKYLFLLEINNEVLIKHQEAGYSKYDDLEAFINKHNDIVIKFNSDASYHSLEKTIFQLKKIQNDLLSIYKRRKGSLLKSSLTEVKEHLKREIEYVASLSIKKRQAGPKKIPTDVESSRKPYNFAIIDYVEPVKGRERDYIKVEGIWQKVHEFWAQQGLILGWGVAKARRNGSGLEYIKWKIVQSKENTDDLYDMDSVEEIVGANDFKILSELTEDSRSIVGTEVVKLSDFALSEKYNTFGELDAKILAFEIGFMTPNAKKFDEYMRMEREIAKVWSQAKVHYDPYFVGWELQEVISRTGKTHPTNFRTINIFRKDIFHNEAQLAVFRRRYDSLNIWPRNLNLLELRRMEAIAFDVIYKTDQSKNRLARLWKDIEGVWVAENPLGDGYRIKTITQHNAKLQVYNQQGELKSVTNNAISIEIIQNRSTFIVYAKDGSKLLSIPFELEDNTLIEYAGPANPDWPTSRFQRADETSER